MDWAKLAKFLWGIRNVFINYYVFPRRLLQEDTGLWKVITFCSGLFIFFESLFATHSATLTVAGRDIHQPWVLEIVSKYIMVFICLLMAVNLALCQKAISYIRKQQINISIYIKSSSYCFCIWTFTSFIIFIVSYKTMVADAFIIYMLALGAGFIYMIYANIRSLPDPKSAALGWVLSLFVILCIDAYDVWVSK